MSLFDNIGKPIIVASHPRSGTHLTIDLLRKQFPACSTYKFPLQSFDCLYLALEALSAPSGKCISEAKALKILLKPQRPIIKTHANPTFRHLDQNFQHWQHWLKSNATILYIIRDGRAVMCSLHLFMQSYDPSTRVSFSEFIRQTINGKSRVKRWANHVDLWLAQPNVNFIRFEDIVKGTPETLAKLSKILILEARYQEPLLPNAIRGLWHGRWLRFSSINPENTAIVGFYRGQKTARWKTEFSKADHEFFYMEAGNLMERLGYNQTS